jgi:predicted DCC family thiol-disulfide oxidoreductase YuxK
MAKLLTVLVDEDCGICTRAGRWLARHEGLLVESIGSAAGAHLLRDLTPTERYAAVHAVDGDGRRSSGGAALQLIARRLPGGRGPASLAARLPRLTEAAYGLVVRNRKARSRLAGLDACAPGLPVDSSAHRRHEPAPSCHTIAASAPRGGLAPPQGGERRRGEVGVDP